ncbi:replication initiator [Luteimicrobium subarcticum]|uniref:Replication initiation protein n=1 Tax=Luteimicrobium subarcticum TaxID=620910 RepID=A0A2M8W6P9_9MICO|nr:replication initiator [Luteimicrobium subarcticum]PJI86574.1 hypothetical protein CLV34_2492 [Luteimicrobium subarcticum]
MTTTATGRFPGYGEHAPLDLTDLPAAASRAVVSRLLDGTFDAFSDAAARVGNCAHPIRLVGSSTTVDAATGEIRSSFSSTDAPLGVLLRPCGNRRADVCPACSRVYARDTFEVIRTGVLGGKTVPDTVSRSPLVFATLTAPSFGHVHGLRDKGAGRCRPGQRGVCEHGRPRSCHTIHPAGDPQLSAPLCWDCYDWTTAVVWQFHAPELWRRFTIALRRRLADRLDVPESRLKHHASVQFAKVAEFQARGLVHFHALIRVDGPDGPGSTAPVDGIDLADLVRQAAPAVECTAPPVDRDDVTRVLRFGAQLDVRTVRTGLASVDDSQALHPDQVAAYLAKYATKSTSTDPSSPSPHLARLDRECRYLAARAATACRPDGVEPDEYTDGCACGHCIDGPYRLLAKWAHMLGFRGHFATKSRRYSVTLGKLRRARARFQRLREDADRDGRTLDTADLETRLLADDDETTLVIGSWTYQGSGWLNPGDKTLADAAAARAREYAQWRATQRA